MELEPADLDALAARLRGLGCVFAAAEAVLLAGHASTRDELDDLVVRRGTGVPLEHLVGWADFGGLRVAVDPGVFVPRARSLLLARAAAVGLRAGAVVADLCCGSGAIGLHIATAVPGVRLHATDIDPVAVGCARRNLTPVAGRVAAGDLFEPLPPGLRLDVAVANVPYVPSAEIALMPVEAREHESPAALDGGGDGLDVLRRLAAEAPAWLVPGGRVLVEISTGQVAAACAALAANGLAPTVVIDDDLDATIVVGRLGR